MTSTLVEPELDDVDTDDPGKLAHYVKKAFIAYSAIEGAEVEAICGYRFVVTRSPEKLPVCGRCKELFDSMHKG